MHNNTADNLLHAFRTFLGMPAETSTPPVCGAVLTEAYDNAPWAERRARAKCPACERILRAHVAKGGAGCSKPCCNPKAAR